MINSKPLTCANSAPAKTAILAKQHLINPKISFTSNSRNLEIYHTINRNAYPKTTIAQSAPLESHREFYVLTIPFETLEFQIELK